MARTRTSITGTNQTTPGAATTQSNLLTDNTTTAGLQINFNATAPASQVALRVETSAANPVFEIPQTGGPIGYGMKIGAGAGVFVPQVSINGQQNPPCLELPNGTRAGLRIWSGTGAPSASKVGTARVGDWYLRRDIVKNPTDAGATFDVLTLTGHLLDATLCPVVFTSVNFTSSPTVTLGTTYYVKDNGSGDFLWLYTDSGGTNLVNITSGGTSSFYLLERRVYVCTSAGTPGTWSAIA